ncbi:hypothetical protein jhhlp_002942 [Lomentospora prolificans]|uniref:Rhodopsin domain-containing protein n=1 Tax=Lomentospora prolificans TaxID=41688 RepID=A0A2N3NFJ9_9PEZI|nr:hypothetical protein jhhlp_002942 [Lomentospora prolificans]
MDSESLVEDDIRSDAGVFLTIAAIMTSLGVLFVAARICSRAISIRKYGADDYLCLVTVAVSLLYLALVSAAITLGGEKHVKTLTREQHGNVLFFTIISFVPGVLSFAIPKFAVVILLVKALQPGALHRTIMWIVSVVYGLGVAVMLILNFVQCSPVQTQWLGADGTCWDGKILVTYGLVVGGR